MILENLLKNHQSVFATLPSLVPVVEQSCDLMTSCLHNDGKIMFCGNGGSAADSQHLAAEFVGRFVDDRPPLSALALSTDTSILTCIGNDYGYEYVFARQVVAIGRRGDVLVAISTSGNSANVILAVQEAKKRGIKVIGMLGRDGGALKELVDIAIVVPSNITANIQEAHIFLGHCFCSMIEQRLGYTRS